MVGMMTRPAPQDVVQEVADRRTIKDAWLIQGKDTFHLVPKSVLQRRIEEHADSSDRSSLASEYRCLSMLLRLMDDTMLDRGHHDLNYRIGMEDDFAKLMHRREDEIWAKFNILPAADHPLSQTLIWPVYRDGVDSCSRDDGAYQRLYVFQKGQEPRIVDGGWDFLEELPPVKNRCFEIAMTVRLNRDSSK